MFSPLLLFFLAVIAIQCIYFLAYWIGIARIRSGTEKAIEPVSILVAARNELENLKTLLPLLYAQDHPDFEIIIVNDQSNDETYDFLKHESSLHANLKVVNVDNNPDHINSKKFALTLGIKAAKNDLILLTDADCTPNSNQWASIMSANAKGKTFVIGYSDYKQQAGFLNYFIRFETLLTALQYLGLASWGNPYMGVGRNLAYRKSFFLSNKGFNGFMKITGGDDDLLVNQHASAANTSLVIEEAAQTSSIPKQTWPAYFKQKLRHLAVGKLYRGKDKIILTLFSLSYILSWLLLPVVLLVSNELYAVISSFLIRTVILHLTFIYSTKKLNVSFNVWGVLLLDLAYVLYYSYTGLAALFTKRITWK